MNYKKKQALAAIVAPLVAISFFSGIVFANDSRASSVQSPLEASVENYSAKDPVQMGPGIAVAVTDAGSVQGFIHRGIYTYRGIPYAQAERFQAPREVKPWTGIRMAVTYGDIAPQDTSKEADIFPPHWYAPHWEARNTAQGEDCQNLNIWTPGIADGKKRPVMVWFHGGGWAMGSASVEDAYNGENLSRKGDVVVISVNHRLNSLGFLDLSSFGEKYRDSGNAGALDLVAALRWVHRNAAVFGGDPDNVTIFGQSGGGAKVLTMTAMPAAKGLFQKAIVESGTTKLSGMSYPDTSATRRVAELTLQHLGLTSSDVGKLETIPYAELSKAANAALTDATKELGSDRIRYWAPVRDGRNAPQNPVVDGFSPNVDSIPLLLGTTLNEWTTPGILANMGIAQSDNPNFWNKETVQEKLKEKYGTRSESVLQAFRKAYPEKKDADALYPDAWMRPNAIETANQKAKQSAPVYNYIFTWETPVMGGIGMAYHCSEIPFVFDNVSLMEEATGGGKSAQLLADKISQAWINFARSGNPNGPVKTGLPQWPTYTEENGATMILDNKSEVRYHHDDDLMKLLNGNG